ncbi:prephenate dehydratase [Tumebacillus permanentifrigoris]|uniref:Prephenate dehydratase n=1 Tax=Tumebacillus permanentifrigoris TaxID=378543 RepID=A0A316D450_9BACL|nr:prephenate dehydratase [Tumebacillus permanentifrigoris]PWK04945.1 prephenate dehydratase [Tumebacillus permanentifrigoris]
MLVGCLGPKGTFTEEASRQYFVEEDVEWSLFPSILDTLEALVEKAVDRVVVPIENSIEGSVTMTLDGLTQYEELFVEAEIVMPIRQNLLALAGTQFDQIREVWSHPQALAQCRHYVRKLGATVKTYDSTAAAAADVAASGRTDVAAIGTLLAAQNNALAVLEASVQDVADNFTRFVVIRRTGKTVAKAEKTLLHVQFGQDQPGALVHVLNVFAALSLNLSHIESRPTRKKLGTYQFFIDVEAGWQEDSLQKAISIVETYGHQVRVLGTMNRHFVL